MNKHSNEDKAGLPTFSLQLADDVREKMKSAGCVFDFTVRALEHCSSTPSTLLHREMLGALFKEIKERGAVDCEVDFDLEQARPTCWSSNQVVNPRSFTPGVYASSFKPLPLVTDFEWLFQSFDDPPYSARCRPGLFAEFCEVVGLCPDQDIEVWDWVGNSRADPGRSTWSNYFDAGKEWWGIWCLTVWNPRKRTLSALAASSTD